MHEITPLSEKDCFYIVERSKKEFTYPLHAHREYELNFIEHGSGVVRTVGDSVERIGDYDLVLVGGDYIEHVWENGSCQSASVREITIQFSPELFADSLLTRTQFASIGKMLEQAKYGLAFPMSAILKVYPILDKISTERNGFYQLMTLFSILYELSMCGGVRTLATGIFARAPQEPDSRRVMKVKRYIEEHLYDDPRLEDAASLVGMTTTSFSRFFKLRTGKTLMEYIIDLRIGNASRMLIDTSRTIAEICFECGFNNVSYFNRIFKKRKGSTPREFRNHFRKSKLVL